MQISQIIRLFKDRLGRNNIGNDQLNDYIVSEISKELGDKADDELFTIAFKVWQCRHKDTSRYIAPYTKPWYRLFEYNGYMYSYSTRTKIIFCKTIDSSNYSVIEFSPEDFLNGNFEQMIERGLSR